VFSAFRNASKVFHRTNHNILFTKLIERSLPMFIITMLVSWYGNQTMQVKWAKSAKFTGALFQCLLLISID